MTHLAKLHLCHIGDYVRIEYTAAGFTAQVEATLAADEDERAQRRAQGKQLLALHTKDAIAKQMRQLMVRNSLQLKAQPEPA